MQEDPDLSFLFSPRSVAVVGGSTGMAPYFLTDLINKGFEGGVYSVNPNRKELVGLKCYPTLTDIPDPVDHVIVAISAHLVPPLLMECAAKNVKACTVFSSGFSELGTDKAHHRVERRKDGGRYRHRRFSHWCTVQLHRGMERDHETIRRDSSRSSGSIDRFVAVVSLYSSLCRKKDRYGRTGRWRECAGIRCL